MSTQVCRSFIHTHLTASHYCSASQRNLHSIIPFASLLNQISPHTLQLLQGAATW